MNCKKLFGAIAVPLVVVLALTLIPLVAMLAAFSSDEIALARMIANLGYYVICISLFFVIWAGYRTANALRGGAIQGGFGGGIIALVVAIAFSLLINPIIIGLQSELVSGLAIADSLNGKFGMVTLILAAINVIIAVIFGFFFGSIGGRLASRSRKNLSQNK